MIEKGRTVSVGSGDWLGFFSIALTLLNLCSDFGAGTRHELLLHFVVGIQILIVNAVHRRAGIGVGDPKREQPNSNDENRYFRAQETKRGVRSEEPSRQQNEDRYERLHLLPNVQDEPRPWLARAVLLGARIVTAMVVGSGAWLAFFLFRAAMSFVSGERLSNGMNDLTCQIVDHFLVILICSPINRPTLLHHSAGGDL
jgi:hypothetical protein